MRLLLVIAVVLPLTAQESIERKAIWTWSIEERLAQRFDPARTSQRMTADDAAERPARWGAVDGASHPELFLPSELFISLMGGLDSDPEMQRVSRDMLRAPIRAFGLEEETFWTELERATQAYLTPARRRAALLSKMAGVRAAEQQQILDEAQRMDVDLCTKRAAALTSARRQFGRETFDRFLYTVVAPSLSIAAVTPSSDTREQLLYVEGGCR